VEGQVKGRFAVLALLAATLASGETFSRRFETIKHEASPEELYRVLYDLPKGGDLHDHLGGAGFPETWWELATSVESPAFYTRVRFGECAAECGIPLLPFHTVRKSSWESLAPCCRAEYEPLAELSAEKKTAWMSSLRIDEAGEGRDEFFEKIWPRIGDVLDEAPIIAESAVENMKLFADEGVRYVEFQLSPFGRRVGDRSLDPDEFHDVLEERITREDALATGVTVRFQTNVLRFVPQAERLVEEHFAFVDRHRERWVSVNLVGREDNDKGYPLRFLETFRKMRRLYPRIGLAIHGGEVDEPNQHVRDTLLLGADRIGHGTNLVTDPDTLLLMRTGKFAVEVSLVSNRLLGYAEDVTEHPFPELFRLGVPVCLSTDDRGMWDSNLTDEYVTAVTEFNLSWEEVVHLGRTSLEFAFVDADVKKRLLDEYDQDVKAFEAKYSAGDWRAVAAGVKARPTGYARRFLLGDDGTRWWGHVQYLASDEMKGRETGTPEHRRAAEYVAEQFEAAGLAPAGENGFLQPVPFKVRRVEEEKSNLEIVRDGKREPVTLGDEAYFSMRIEHAPELEAQLAFVGYGLTVPEEGHDDLAGIDLKGKVALLFTGGPENIPGPLLAHYQSAGERWKFLEQAGAVGIIAIRNPRGQDVPWDRAALSRFMPAMELTDPALAEAQGQKLSVTYHPDAARKLFEGSGHDYAAILAAAQERKPLPRFELPISIAAKVAFTNEERRSENVVAILRGSDEKLANEYVVLSAHLDHVGIGRPIDGDEIYNGAMDNASGIATLIETARLLREGPPPRRSIVLVAVTGEEKGLLGSRYYAAHPTVSRDGIVANMNTDMFSPLFPLQSLIVQGLEESDLAQDLERAARAAGIEVLSDPEPERNAFTRSDQYSFIRQGVPSLSLKVGFAKDSPEHEIVLEWRRVRYHAPSDDLEQPVDLKAAADFNRVYARAVSEVANRESRPRWNDTSFFRRFAR
jgi:adenosine deaminase